MLPPSKPIEQFVGLAIKNSAITAKLHPASRQLSATASPLDALNVSGFIEYENITGADKSILEFVGHDSQSDLGDLNKTA